MTYDCLRLSNQLCFPLYALSHSITKAYKPFLDQIGLTYTQYITMMVLWEYDEISVKDLGKHLYLDSGTLTPLLKRLEKKNYIIRKRSIEDERSVLISLTDEGRHLQEEAKDIPFRVGSCIPLSQKEAGELYELLYKALKGMNQYD